MTPSEATSLALAPLQLCKTCFGASAEAAVDDNVLLGATESLRQAIDNDLAYQAVAVQALLNLSGCQKCKTYYNRDIQQCLTAHGAVPALLHAAQSLLDKLQAQQVSAWDHLANIFEALHFVCLHNPNGLHQLAELGGWSTLIAGIAQGFAEPRVSEHGCLLLAQLACSNGASVEQVYEAAATVARTAQHYRSMLVHHQLPVQQLLPASAAVSSALWSLVTIGQVSLAPAQHAPGGFSALLWPLLSDSVLGVVIEAMAAWRTQDVALTRHAMDYFTLVATTSHAHQHLYNQHAAYPNGSGNGMPSSQSLVQLLSVAAGLVVHGLRTLPTPQLQAAALQSLQALLGSPLQVQLELPLQEAVERVLSVMADANGKADGPASIKAVVLVQVHGLCILGQLLKLGAEQLAAPTSCQAGVHAAWSSIALYLSSGGDAAHGLDVEHGTQPMGGCKYSHQCSLQHGATRGLDLAMAAAAAAAALRWAGGADALNAADLTSGNPLLHKIVAAGLPEPLMAFIGVAGNELDLFRANAAGLDALQFARSRQCIKAAHMLELAANGKLHVQQQPQPQLPDMLAARNPQDAAGAALELPAHPHSQPPQQPQQQAATGSAAALGWSKDEPVFPPPVMRSQMLPSGAAVISRSSSQNSLATQNQNHFPGSPNALHHPFMSSISHSNQQQHLPASMHQQAAFQHMMQQQLLLERQQQQQQQQQQQHEGHPITKNHSSHALAASGVRGSLSPPGSPQFRLSMSGTGTGSGMVDAASAAWPGGAAVQQQQAGGPGAGAASRNMHQHPSLANASGDPNVESWLLAAAAAAGAGAGAAGMPGAVTGLNPAGPPPGMNPGQWLLQRGSMSPGAADMAALNASLEGFNLSPTASGPRLGATAHHASYGSFADLAVPDSSSMAAPFGSRHTSSATLNAPSLGGMGHGHGSAINLDSSSRAMARASHGSLLGMADMAAVGQLPLRSPSHNNMANMTRNCSLSGALSERDLHLGSGSMGSFLGNPPRSPSSAAMDLMLSPESLLGTTGMPRVPSAADIAAAAAGAAAIVDAKENQENASWLASWLDGSSAAGSAAGLDASSSAAVAAASAAMAAEEAAGLGSLSHGDGGTMIKAHADLIAQLLNSVAAGTLQGPVPPWLSAGLAAAAAAANTDAEALLSQGSGGLSPRVREHSSSGSAGPPDLGDLIKGPSKHLWLGNLNTRVPRSVLKAVFEHFGAVEDVVTFPGRMYAFVNFRNPEDAQRAAEALNEREVPPITSNRKLVVKFRPSKKALGRVGEGTGEEEGEEQEQQQQASEEQQAAQGTAEPKPASEPQVIQGEGSSAAATAATEASAESAKPEEQAQRSSSGTAAHTLQDMAAAAMPSDTVASVDAGNDAKAADGSMDDAAVGAVTVLSNTIMEATALAATGEGTADSDGAEAVDIHADEDDGSGGSGELPEGRPSRHLWLGNIPLKPNKAAMEMLFSAFGPLESVRVFPGKTFAFVNFVNPLHAIAAKVQLDGQAAPAVTGSKPMAIRFQKDTSTVPTNLASSGSGGSGNLAPAASGSMGTMATASSSGVTASSGAAPSAAGGSAKPAPGSGGGAGLTQEHRKPSALSLVKSMGDMSRSSSTTNLTGLAAVTNLSRLLDEDVAPEPAVNLSNRLNPNNIHFDKELAARYKRMTKAEKEALWAQDRAMQQLANNNSAAAAALLNADTSRLFPGGAGNLAASVAAAQAQADSLGLGSFGGLGSLGSLSSIASMGNLASLGSMGNISSMNNMNSMLSRVLSTGALDACMGAGAGAAAAAAQNAGMFRVASYQGMHGMQGLLGAQAASAALLQQQAMAQQQQQQTPQQQQASAIAAAAAAAALQQQLQQLPALAAQHPHNAVLQQQAMRLQQQAQQQHAAAAAAAALQQQFQAQLGSQPLGGQLGLQMPNALSAPGLPRVASSQAFQGAGLPQLQQLQQQGHAAAIAAAVANAFADANAANATGAKQRPIDQQQQASLLAAVQAAHAQHQQHPHQHPHQQQTGQQVQQLLGGGGQAPKVPKQLPGTFLCPISRSIMLDPVVASDGVTYDRSSILEWMQNNDVSPVTRQPLANRYLAPNVGLRTAIMNELGRLS